MYFTLKITVMMYSTMSELAIGNVKKGASCRLDQQITALSL